MKWVQTVWPLVRDILLTCTGLVLIISQVGAKDPSSTLIVAGLALTVPAAATHAAAVLSGPSGPSGPSPPAGHGPPSSSEPSPPPASLPSSPSPTPGGGTGEQRHG